MHLQEPGDFRDWLLFLVDELALVRDLLGRKGRGWAEPHARAFAAIRPALVRSTIKGRSKSAIPANTVNTMRPAGVVVSAHGSASERSQRRPR